MVGFEKALGAVKVIKDQINTGLRACPTYRVATNMENMENLENSGNLKNCQNLRENSGKFGLLWKNLENSGKM